MNISDLENELKKVDEKAQFHLEKYNECVKKLKSLRLELNEAKLNTLEFKVGSEIKVTTDIKIRNIIFYLNPVMVITLITNKFFYLKLKSGVIKISHKNGGYSDVSKIELNKEEFSLLCDYTDHKIILEREKGLQDLGF